ncbi:hypothetical protein D3C78_1805380 [compost metagenome]
MSTLRTIWRPTWALTVRPQRPVSILPDRSKYWLYLLSAKPNRLVRAMEYLNINGP